MSLVLHYCLSTNIGRPITTARNSWWSPSPWSNPALRQEGYMRHASASFKWLHIKSAQWLSSGLHYDPSCGHLLFLPARHLSPHYEMDIYQECSLQSVKSQASAYNCAGKTSLRGGLKYYIKQFTGKSSLNGFQPIDSVVHLPYSFLISKILPNITRVSLDLFSLLL